MLRRAQVVDDLAERGNLFLAERERQEAVDVPAHVVAETVVIHPPAAAETIADELQFELEKKEFAVDEAFLHFLDAFQVQGLRLVNGAQGGGLAGEIVPAHRQFGQCLPSHPARSRACRR